ncbi:MAG TPA: ABC-type transport auxiliary lipoprotein family protein [Alphaproteobacteria bacterium]|nr:ABC-type transport auxiliary lipoprotein family protein [Alphaproteobacteria bacterium]HQS93184.1 ABC-type transport auxiliary lipoprotein family protein [Alphaproteobacteria bacterium]
MFLTKRSIFMRVSTVFLGCFSLLILSGCMNLPKNSEKYKLFYLKTLPFSEKERASLHPVKWQLILEDPSCDGRLNTDRIVVQTSSAEITHVSGARWVDRLPNLIQQLLLNLFENSGQIKGVGTSLDGLDADYVLLIDIRDFELMVRESKEVRIRIFGKIMRLKDREIVGAKTFESMVPIPQDSFKEVIDAFLTATNRVGKEIVIWTLETPQFPDFPSMEATDESE